MRTGFCVGVIVLAGTFVPGKDIRNAMKLVPPAGEGLGYGILFQAKPAEAGTVVGVKVVTLPLMSVGAKRDASRSPSRPLGVAVAKGRLAGVGETARMGEEKGVAEGRYPLLSDAK